MVSTGLDCHVYQDFQRWSWATLAGLYTFHFLFLILTVWPVLNKDGFRKCWEHTQLRVMMVGGISAPLRLIEGVVRFKNPERVGE